MRLFAGLCLIGAWASAGTAAAENEPHSPILFALRIVGLASTKQRVEPQKELKVIGAGFPRTGTKSTKRALEMLGYKVFHMEDLMSNAGMSHQFLKALADPSYQFEKFTQAILQLGYNATLDGPNNGFVFDWAKRFPDAKVLYGVRDTPEQWAKSFYTLNHNFRYTSHFPFSALVDFSFSECAWKAKMGFVMQFVKTPLTPWFSNVTVTFDKPLEQVYREWDHRVRTELDPARVLVFNVREGWDPLVKFLGVSRPPQGMEFPQINESESLAVINAFLMGVCLTWPLLAAAAFVVACFVGEWLAGGMRRVARLAGFGGGRLKEQR